MKKLALRSHMSPRAATNNPSHPMTNRKISTKPRVCGVPFFSSTTPMYDLFFSFQVLRASSCFLPPSFFYLRSMSSHGWGRREKGRGVGQDARPHRPAMHRVGLRRRGAGLPGSRALDKRAWGTSEQQSCGGAQQQAAGDTQARLFCSHSVRCKTVQRNKEGRRSHLQ